MAIQDDFTVDVVDKKITYTTAFVEDRPPNIYTVNQLYSFLQDTFDEPNFLQHEIPMSAQTPTQYTLINTWFMDDESMKALYGGSIQTSAWTKSGAAGITQIRWNGTPATPPEASDVGETWTGGTSGATGVVLAVDTNRQVAWLRNTSAAQFINNESVSGPGSDPVIQTETLGGVQSGESIWANLFSVGSLQANTEIYVGQEDDQMGGRAYHTPTPINRRIEKLDEWWDADVDFTASPNLLGGLGHFDILVKTTEAGAAIDSSRLAVFARQFSKVYSHFELTGGVGNFVVPFASTGSDLNSQVGPYQVAFDGRTGADMLVGDVLENNAHGGGSNDPAGRLRAVVTAVTGGASATGTIDYYLIGENEPNATFDRTLDQLSDNDDLGTRGTSNDFDVDGAVTLQGPALAGGVTITFDDNQVDVDEDGTPEEYACTIDCNNVALATVYRHTQFLTSRGNQDGTTADVQDLLLPTHIPDGYADGYEAGEFYRAVGDITFQYDGGVGTQVVNGDSIVNDSGGATGVIVSGGNGAMGTSGTVVLTQVVGTFADGDQIARPGEHGTNHIVINEPTTGPVAIVDNTAAPFGTFAGGRWFVSQGVVLINVPTADANNWQTTDLDGVVRIPPTVRTITFAGLAINDRAALLEVDTAGGVDVTKSQESQTVGVAGAGVGATTIPIENTVALDVPTTGWIRVVDVSSTTGEEFRYAYSAVSGTTVTLDSGGNFSGTAEAPSSTTILTDTGAFTSFGGAGELRTGMLIRNTTDSEYATILRKIDNDSIETSPLTGAASWDASDGWIANDVVVALVDADTLYFPFVDDTATTTSISKLIKFVHVTECIARARFSDPDVGGTRILPFVQKSIQITDANLTITAIRTTDSIAT